MLYILKTHLINGLREYAILQCDALPFTVLARDLNSFGDLYTSICKYMYRVRRVYHIDSRPVYKLVITLFPL